MEAEGHTWEGRSVGVWVEELGNPDGEARWRAIDALRHIADPSQSVPLFVRSLKDPYPRARALAVHALYDMAFEEPLVPVLSQAVAALTDALSDPYEDVAVGAARTLELLGPSALRELPRLREAASSASGELRSAALAAIATVSGRVRVRRLRDLDESEGDDNRGAP